MAPVPKETAPAAATCMNGVALSSGDVEILGALKAQVPAAQFRARRVLNKQPIELYRTIAREILTQ